MQTAASAAGRSSLRDACYAPTARPSFGQNEKAAPKGGSAKRAISEINFKETT